MRFETIQALLAALKRCSRGATAAQIAKMLGWHRSATHERLVKLTALKIVKRRAIPRPTSAGRPQFRYSAGRRVNA